MKNKKVIVLYRVLQEWRAPIFEKLSNSELIDLEVWFGPDIKGTKLVSTKKKFTFKRTKMFSFKIKLNSKNGIIAMPFSPLLIFKLLIANPQVIIAEGASNILNSVQGFIYSKIAGKKFIWWSLGKLQNRDYDVKRSKVDKLIQFIERKSDAVITYSSVGEKYFLSLGIQKSKIFKAVNVVDTDAIFEKLNSNNDCYQYKDYKRKYKFINLFVGSLTKEKSIDILLHAQKKIEDNYEDCGLLIIGDGSYRNNLEELSRNLGLKNVEFLGQILDDNYKYFSIADIFTLPGLGGLAISEAMCYGLPVIASIGDGCEVDLLNNDNGIIQPNMTSESLFKHLEGLILHDKRRKEMGKNSLKVITEKYNVANYLNQIINAINN